MKRNTKFIRVYDSEADALFALNYGYIPRADDPRLLSGDFDDAVAMPLPRLPEEVLKAIPRNSIVHAILATK